MPRYLRAQTPRLSLRVLAVEKVLKRGKRPSTKSSQARERHLVLWYHMPTLCRCRCCDARVSPRLFPWSAYGGEVGAESRSRSEKTVSSSHPLLTDVRVSNDAEHRNHFFREARLAAGASRSQCAFSGRQRERNIGGAFDPRVRGQRIQTTSNVLAEAPLEGHGACNVVRSA